MEHTTPALLGYYLNFLFPGRFAEQQQHQWEEKRKFPPISYCIIITRIPHAAAKDKKMRIPLSEEIGMGLFISARLRVLLRICALSFWSTITRFLWTLSPPFLCGYLGRNPRHWIVVHNARC
ncbi:uncharacterized protein MCYG_08054 [Microsporum canis CBS 113480]|uniref:Uncharacterized protein n=1 Tax=Arthroderma otae (strain ATCC MYA-4605 / CBS 113480) TaxID=554155 RepID=C5FZD2_ARTOC|nr:uncharacterized protein MCYG_08054 [Microsporum canis CBS 113480]EEQ35235.1 predicted protein [Microsporum canis CBS 113480]